MAKLKYRTGRPRSEGDRYPSGKLKPVGPNPRVVEMRRALLLGTEASSDVRIDLSKAENALDVALARFWISEDQHRAARRYGSLCRRVVNRALGSMPVMKVSRGLEARSSALAVDEGVIRSGVTLQADLDLAKAIADFDAGRIDARALSKAEKIHRLAKVDWSTVPSAEIEAIFNAALDLENYVPPVEDAEDAETLLLHEIWSRLSREEAQELFSVCVLDSWPQWVIQRANGHFQTPWERKRAILVDGLEKVVRTMLKPPALRPAPQIAEPTSRPLGPVREEVTEYVTPDGDIVLQVVRRIRRIEPLIHQAEDCD